VAEGLGIGELLRELDAGRGGPLLDVRNADEFAAWRVEARAPFETIHVPYFGFLEDPEAALARLPRGREIRVLCAKGGSSEMVAGMLVEAGVRARNVEGGMVAYGEFLAPARVPGAPDGAEVWQLVRRGKGCLSYVVARDGKAVVVDPSRNLEAYERLVRRLDSRIVAVLDTHVHADHASGGPGLAARARAPYHVEAGAGFELRHRTGPALDAAAGLGLRAIPAPGHTPGSTLFLLGGTHLLSGDTLFTRGVGRPDLGGDAEAWGRSLFRTLRDRVGPLDDGTLVLPSHYGGTDELRADGTVAARLGELRREVPEMRIRDEEEFAAAMRRSARPAPEAYLRLVQVNLGELQPEEEKLVEWELGRNECAAHGAGGRR